jgi:hypothetical protein
VAIQPTEIANLKTFLGKPKDGGTPAEVSAFESTLREASLDTIQAHLDERTITRLWKRDLAEAEFGRRERESVARDEDLASGLVETQERKDARIRHWGGWIAALLIALCSLVILYTGFAWWSM